MIDGQELTFRRVTIDDAMAVAQLSGQLGYPTSEEEVRQRIGAIGASPGQAVFVACLGDEVVGWIDVALTQHLQCAAYALIGGLVVRETVRGQGIGKRLCEQAEAWVREQGVATIRVTSRSTRVDAHRFYLRERYKDLKTSRIFEKIFQD